MLTTSADRATLPQAHYKEIKLEMKTFTDEEVGLLGAWLDAAAVEFATEATATKTARAEAAAKKEGTAKSAGRMCGLCLPRGSQATQASADGIPI